MAQDQGAYSMSRRSFCSTLAGVLVAPGIAMAQASKVRRIGHLTWGLPDTPDEAELQAAPLRALGWVEFRNLLIERRHAESAELLDPMAQELVRLKVEIIVAWGTDAVLAAKNATTTIPIVIGSADDPVASGLVASLARPGGNVTGFSIVGPELDAKRLSLLRELVPRLQRVGFPISSDGPLRHTVRTRFEKNCQSLGLEPIVIEIAAVGELENGIEEIARRGAQALVVDSAFIDDRVAFMRAALKYRLPTIAHDKSPMEAGALAYFAPSHVEFTERYAAFVDRILRGAKPADLPIEQPTKFELGFNLKTAKALGITVPQSLLLRANEVIQ